MTALPVTPDDVRAARALLDGVVRTTPLEHSRALSDLVGGDVHLKCENLQRAGSFKIRGAYTRMARLPAAQRAAGVVAASAGNHAQGVALAGHLLGIDVTVLMPTGAPLPKIDATRAYGADVRLHGHTVDECLAAASRYAADTGAVLLHPFDHPDVVAGQGTVGLEVLEQCPDVRTVLSAVGGGGLLAGLCVALKGDRPGSGPGPRVVGVQAVGAAAYPPSLAAGHPVDVPDLSTMADGIAVGRPGDVPFGIVRALADDVVTVGEEALSGALLHLLERAKLVVEPAGAAAVGALLEGRVEVEPPVVVVLSGGNVDPLLLMRVIRHGMAAAGRYLQLRVLARDRPGALASLLLVLADVDANVLEVEHVRTGATLAVDQVEIGVQVETKGPEHCDDVVSALRAAGYTLTRV